MHLHYALLSRAGGACSSSRLLGGGTERFGTEKRASLQSMIAPYGAGSRRVVSAEALIEPSDTRSSNSICLSTSLFCQKVHLKQCSSTLKLNVASDASLAPIEFDDFVRLYRRAF